MILLSQAYPRCERLFGQGAETVGDDGIRGGSTVSKPITDEGLLFSLQPSYNQRLSGSMKETYRNSLHLLKNATDG